MAEKKDEQLVIALFDTYEAGERAAKSLKKWDKANKDIKLGAIGLVLGIFAAVLPAVTWVSGVVGGTVAGGFLGIFSKQGIGLSEENLAYLKRELSKGKAALVVLCDDEEVADTEAELESLGGQTESYQGSMEDLEQVAQEVYAPPPDETEG